MRSLVIALGVTLMSGACRLGQVVETKGFPALASPKPEWFAGRITVQGELDVHLPLGLSPAETLSGSNAARVRQLVEWQLQYLHGALRNGHGSAPLSPTLALVGQRDIRLIGVTIGSRPTIATVSYEYKDSVIAMRELPHSTIDAQLPRDVSGIFAKTIIAGGSSPANPCAMGAPVPEDHLWYFWSPREPACRLGPEDLVTVRAALEPVPTEIPRAPDYESFFGRSEASPKVRMTYVIGDDRSYGQSADSIGREAFDRAVDLLTDSGFTLKAIRPDKRGALLHARVGKTSVSLEVRLLDPGSFEFVRTTAAAMESADVFVYNGQSGFGNYIDWNRYERALGRKLDLPSRPQIFAFNGASPFTTETARLFAAKSTAEDPEGFAGLDVVTTVPGFTPINDAMVAVDVALLAGIISDERPSWPEILRDSQLMARQRGVLTYLTGGR